MEVVIRHLETLKEISRIPNIKQLSVVNTIFPTVAKEIQIVDSNNQLHCITNPQFYDIVTLDITSDHTESMNRLHP